MQKRTYKPLQWCWVSEICEYAIAHIPGNETATLLNRICDGGMKFSTT